MNDEERSSTKMHLGVLRVLFSLRWSKCQLSCLTKQLRMPGIFQQIYEIAQCSREGRQSRVIQLHFTSSHNGNTKAQSSQQMCAHCCHSH